MPDAVEESLPQLPEVGVGDRGLGGQPRLEDLAESAFPEGLVAGCQLLHQQRACRGPVHLSGGSGASSQLAVRNEDRVA